jgi:ribonuclease R
MTVTNGRTPPRVPSTTPTSTPAAATTQPSTTLAHAPTTSMTAATSTPIIDGVDGVDARRPATSIAPSPTAPTNSTAPVGRTPSAALVTDRSLNTAGSTAAALANAADGAVAAVFSAASDAVARVRKATSVEVPLRLSVTTGKGTPPRLPSDVPGLVKPRGEAVTFYPADESIQPFDVPADVGKNLPHGVVLVARATKKSVDFTLADGTAAKTPVYRLNGEGAAAPRARFVGVVDLVDGEPFVRDLVPPPRLARLPATAAGGRPWEEGAIVDVAVPDDGAPATVHAELAHARSPQARTWAIAGAEKLDANFSPRCQTEATALAAAQPTSLADRSLVDLSKKPFFAIDNPGSTDIDQAMLLEKRPDGGYVISYALADASHYIKPGMALFDEAMKRGASYYLPGLSIPMLPEELSEGAISLNAHEDHRALVLQIRLDKDGNVEGPADVLRAKIHSQAQLTYGGVSTLLQEKKPIAADEHGKPVPRAVTAQLALFEEIGQKRIDKARARGVVEPERREMRIGFDDARFFLTDRKADYASKLNAELSILANVGGAEALSSTKLSGVWVPGIFKTHEEPAPSTYAALARQVNVIVDRNGLAESWRWDQRTESLATWVERVKTLPDSPRERALSLVLQTAAVRINVASSYEREPGTHSGLKVQAYGRFSAPMREQVGVISHAVLFAKDALERCAVEAKLSPEQARALWAPLLLGATVPSSDIPEARRALSAQAQALLSTSGPERAALATTLAAQAMKQAPALSAEEQKLVDGVFDRAMGAGNNSKIRQGQVESAALRLLFDDLFLSDLGGNPEGNKAAPRRAGVITAVTPAKVYVQLNDPDVEVRIGLDDLRRLAPGAKFHLEEEACALVSDAAGGGPLSRLYVGAEVKVQATHHDGEKLHFTIAENGG